jgi:hypothetical protein
MFRSLEAQLLYCKGETINIALLRSEDHPLLHAAAVIITAFNPSSSEKSFV